jgi:selenoprotein W-related protein
MKDVVITYCKPCGYLKHAQAAAAAINEKLGVDAQLVPGKGGIFQIAVDGQVVAKRTSAGFPKEDDVVAALQEALS